MNKPNIFIIGGGAAGFFCAANIDQKKYSVTILEQNADVLQKVKISGGGRCNVSNACFDPKELVTYYPRGNKELRSVFSKFQPADTMEWFESKGLTLKIEEDNRIFPTSDSSLSIINLLKNEIDSKNFLVKTKCVVKDVKPTENGYTIETTIGDFLADIVVYTSGSAPKSLNILKNLGHTIIDLVPSLFTFNVKNELINELSGTSFPDATIKIPILKAEETGPLLITHWGLSGPAVLKLSAWQAIALAKLKYQFPILINFLSIPEAEADRLLTEYKSIHPKKTIQQAKIYNFTQRFWSRVLEIVQINPQKQLAQLSAKEQKAIVMVVSHYEMKVIGKSTFKEEFVTAGGVSLKEINFKNMASTLLDHFYLAGEVLNIDGVTGGFNFQACWSEAWLIAQDLNSKI